MLHPKTYLNISDIEYQLNDNEMIILESLLTSEYFKQLEPYYTVGNSRITYEIANPLKSQKYANDILLLDNPNNVNNIGYDIIPASTGYGIKIDRGSSIVRDNTVYLANGMVSPTVYDMGFQGFFQRGVAYRIQGRFGWDAIPDEVSLATIELMKDFFNKDTQWKHKYVKNIQTFDWNFEYDPQVYSGTGNFYADSVLSNYVVKQMLVI